MARRLTTATQPQTRAGEANGLPDLTKSGHFSKILDRTKYAYKSKKHKYSKGKETTTK